MESAARPSTSPIPEGSERSSLPRGSTPTGDEGNTQTRTQIASLLVHERRQDGHRFSPRRTEPLRVTFRGHESAENQRRLDHRFGSSQTRVTSMNSFASVSVVVYTNKLFNHFYPARKPVATDRRETSSGTATRGSRHARIHRKRGVRVGRDQPVQFASLYGVPG